MCRHTALGIYLGSFICSSDCSNRELSKLWVKIPSFDGSLCVTPEGSADLKRIDIIEDPGLAQHHAPDHVG